MFAQNLATLDLRTEQVSGVDTSLEGLEVNFVDLIALSATQKKQMIRLGEKSEVFCRATLLAMEQNPEVIPPNLKVADALADLRAREVLLPRLRRLEKLYQRAVDTYMALGSDAMAVAMQGYRQLKLSGRSAGLEALQRDLGNRFAKTRRPAAKGGTKPNPPEVPTA